MRMKPKTIQQIIDGQAIRRPMDKSFNSAVLESKRKPPDSAWWHMRHRPYSMGGDAGDAGGDDKGAAGGLPELPGGDPGAAV